jgi:hypothetical protein
MATARGVKLRPVSSVKVLGCQTPSASSDPAAARQLPGSCRTATGIAGRDRLVPSGQRAALALVRKIEATPG